jgi:L-aspartate oxidase
MTLRGGIPEPMTFPELTEEAIRELTWKHCGISRCAEGLSEAVDVLGSAAEVSASHPSRPQFELRNIHTVALLIARSALAREESRGGHYRTDFPETREEFRRHSSVRKDDDQITFE